MEQQSTGGIEIQFVVFKLGNEEYGVPITQVKEINRLTRATKIPKSPMFIEGIINLRGQIIPIVDLKKRFDLPLTEYTGDARIIVIQVFEQVFGVEVDSVSEVLRINSLNIEPAPQLVCSIDAKYIAGVAKVSERLLIMLDLDKLLNDEEKAMLNDEEKVMLNDEEKAMLNDEEKAMLNDEEKAMLNEIGEQPA